MKVECENRPPHPGPLPQGEREQGFTLTEVLIGTAVLGLAIATFLISTRHALRLVEKSDLELQALRQAENLLAMGGTFREGARLVRVPPEEELPPGLTLFRVDPSGTEGWYVEILSGS